MITQVKVGHKFVNISIAIVDGEGKAVDPTSAEAWCYKVSQIDGSLNLDTNINGTGIVSLSKQDSQTGFWGASINVESFSEAEYVILYKVIFPALTSITVDSLSIDLSKKTVAEIKTDTDKIPRILGLVQENFRLYDIIYSGDNIVMSKIKVYASKADCDADVNAIAIYQATATYDANGKLINYKVTKM